MSALEGVEVLLILYLSLPVLSTWRDAKDERPIITQHENTARQSAVGK